MFANRLLIQLPSAGRGPRPNTVAAINTDFASSGVNYSISNQKKFSQFGFDLPESLKVHRQQLFNSIK